MIKVKNFAALALAAVMLCSVQNPVRAEQAAAEPIAVSYDKSKLASADDRITIRFSLPADTAANGAEVRITYPEDKILVGGVETGTLYESAYMSSYEDDPGEFKAFALNDVTFEGGGDIISVTLGAAENASGTAELTVTTLYTTVDLDSEENEYKISISLPGIEEAEEGETNEPSATLSPSHSPASGGGAGTNGGGSGSNEKPAETESPSEPERPFATASPSETEHPSATERPADEADSEPENEFSDIAGHWAEDSIIELAGRGLINGFDDGTFRPEEAVTRAQFTKMLVDLMGLNTNTVLRIFEDVPTNAWYAPYVTAAYAEGIALGDGAYFRPDSSITREEMAVMAARCVQISATGMMDFTDRESVSDWAKDAVDALASAGIINGFEDGTFRPDGISTRAEAAVILLRLDGADI